MSFRPSAYSNPGVRMGAGPATGQYYVTLAGERGMSPDGWHWGYLAGRIPELVKIKGPLVPGTRIQFKRMHGNTATQWAILRDRKVMPQHSRGLPGATGMPGPGMVGFDAYSMHPGVRVVVPPVPVPNPQYGMWPFTQSGRSEDGKSASVSTRGPAGLLLLQRPTQLALVGVVLGAALAWKTKKPYKKTMLKGAGLGAVAGVAASLGRFTYNTVTSDEGYGDYGWASAYPESKLTVSATGDRLGLDNRPQTSSHNSNLSRLSDFLAKLPFNFAITSGYRSPEVNKAVGGSSTSQHPNGLAVDAVPQEATNKDVATWLFDNRVNFPELDQVIWYTDSSHVHVGICPAGATNCPRRAGPRGEFYKAKSEGSVYIPWAPTAEETAYMAARYAKHRPLQTAGAIWAVSLIGAVSTLGFLVLLDKKMKRVRARKAAEGELG